MNELVKLVVSQLGINEQQATGGLGSIMKLAQEHLGADFSHIENILPEVQKLISHAPTVTDGAAGGVAGLAGVVGSALSAFGMGDSKLAGLAALAGQFKSLNLDADMIAKFAPIVTGFLQQQSGAAGTTGSNVAADLIQKFLKG